LVLFIRNKAYLTFIDKMSARAEILLYLFISLMIGSATTYVLARMERPLPYTAVLFIEGALISILHDNAGKNLYDFTTSIDGWLTMDGEVLLFIFLPPLLYGEAMSLNWFHTKEVVGQCLLLAGLGVLMESFIVGPLMYLVLPHEWPFKLCMLVAAITSATDPVAVVALLKDMNASTQLTMLIVGESLLNDGTGMAFFELFKGMMEGEEYASSVGNIIQYILKILLVSPLIGIAVGIVSIFALRMTNRHEPRDKLMQVVVTVIASYASFYFAQHNLGVSGVLSTCAAGLSVAKWGTPLVMDYHMMHTIWEFMEWSFNTGNNK
jgi:solute carrier family 9 (sodium/hydrogen exchanger), member 10/11